MHERRSRTTDGTVDLRCARRAARGPTGGRKSAFWPSTSTTARRAATVPSGSYDALSTRDRPIGAPNVTCGPLGGGVPNRARSTTSCGRRVFGRDRRTASRRGSGATHDRAPGGTAVVATTGRQRAAAPVEPRRARGAAVARPRPRPPASSSHRHRQRRAGAHVAHDVDEGVERRCAAAIRRATPGRAHGAAASGRAAARRSSGRTVSTVEDRHDRVAEAGADAALQRRVVVGPEDEAGLDVEALEARAWLMAPHWCAPMADSGRPATCSTGTAPIAASGLSAGASRTIGSSSTSVVSNGAVRRSAARRR